MKAHHIFMFLTSLLVIMLMISGCNTELVEPDDFSSNPASGADTIYFKIQGNEFTTGNVDNINYASARMAGHFQRVNTSNNKVSDHGHVWAPAPNSNPVIGDASANHSSLGERTLPGTFFSQLGNLTSGRLYYVRSYIRVNGQYIFHDNIVSFATLVEGPPSMQLAVPSNVTQSSMEVNGTILGDGGSPITEYGFVYSKAVAEPTLAVNDGKVTFGPANANTSFTTTLVGLEHTSFYNIRAYATNASGTGYSPAQRRRTNSPYVVDNGLIAYYTFEGNFTNAAGIADYNGTGFNVAYSPDTPDGLGSSGQFFPASSAYASVPVNPFFQLGQASVSLWIKSTNLSSQYIIHGNKLDSRLGFGIGFSLPSTSSGAIAYNGIDPSSNLYKWNHNFPDDWSSELLNGDWNLLTLTISSGQTSLYINGQLKAQKTPGEAIRHNGINSGMIIGRYLNFGNIDYFFNGLMDNLRIYNRVLTSAEVLEIYNAKQ